MNKTTILFPNQITAYNDVMTILNKSHFCLIDGPTGSGKTVVSIQVALDLQLDLFVIGPLASLIQWEREADKYKIPFVGYSYKKLSRSQDIQDPKHGLLMKKIRSGQIIYYYGTKDLDALIHKGTLIVIDECHNIVGDSIQAKAVAAIVKRVEELDTRSKVLGLSASMVSSPSELHNLLKVMHVIKGNLASAKALEQFNNFANRFTDEKLIKASNLWEYFIQHLRDKIIAHIHVSYEADLIVKNLYMQFSERETEKLYGIKLNQLEEMSKTRFQMTQLKTTLAEMQFLKKDLVLELVHICMKGKCKLILYASFIAILKYWYEQLAIDYNVGLILGTDKKEDRQQIIDLFNEDNDKLCILICTPMTGATSLNLDDRTGNWPRIALALPDYRTKTQHQLTGRFFRQTTVGTAKVYFVFGRVKDYGPPSLRKPPLLEASLVGKIYSRGLALKEFHATEDVLFPCDYPNEYI